MKYILSLIAGGLSVTVMFYSFIGIKWAFENHFVISTLISCGLLLSVVWFVVISKIQQTYKISFKGFKKK